MAQVCSTRRALIDLPINTSANHQPAILVKEDLSSLKRPFHEVEEPEVQPAAIRPRTHHHKVGQNTPEKRIIEDRNDFITEIASLNVIKRPRLDVVNIFEDLEEGSSQHSSKDSISTSTTDFDVGNETTASQETAQTDLTQSLESLAYMHAETLRLRLRVALFKVQTNQTNIPMSRLNVSATGTRESHAKVSKSPRSQDKAVGSKLLPVSVLHPATYSARMSLREQVSSSLLHSTEDSPVMIRHDDYFESPEIYKQRQQGSVHQLI